MIAEVIAIGTELLLGQTINTNGSLIGATLADLGFDAHYQVIVGDNLARMERTIRTALNRADVVIITGGIGPTQDDITRPALAAATDRELLFSAQYAQELEQRFASWGQKMPLINRQQAEYPAGSEMLTNRVGTAPGLALLHQGKMVFVLPGVPAEMEPMLSEQIRPRLQRLGNADQVLVSRMLKTWGRSESWVAEQLDEIYHQTTNPSVAFLAGGGEIKIRLSAKAGSEAEALQLINPVEQQVRQRLGSIIYGVDQDTIEVVLQDLLSERGWSIGTAESATGGMVAARLTSLPGSSRFFRGSFVTYDRELKGSLLDISAEQLDQGLVTERMALAMATGAQTRLGVEVAVSVTGSAGPKPLEQEAGTLVIGVATPEHRQARVLRLPGDRQRVRTFGTVAALHLVRLAVLGKWWKQTPNTE